MLTLIEAGYPDQISETPVGFYVQTGHQGGRETIRQKVLKIIAMPDVKTKPSRPWASC